MDNEIFKIGNITFQLDDYCRIVNCSDPDFEERLKKDIKKRCYDRYYEDKEKHEIIKFGFNETGDLMVQVFDSNKMTSCADYILHTIADEFKEDSYLVTGE